MGSLSQNDVDSMTQHVRDGEGRKKKKERMGRTPKYLLPMKPWTVAKKAFNAVAVPSALVRYDLVKEGWDRNLNYLLPMEPGGCVQKSFKIVCRWHPLLFGFLANGCLPNATIKFDRNDHPLMLLRDKITNFITYMYLQINCNVFVFVLMEWSLLPNELRPFKIYCAPPNITRT